MSRDISAGCLWHYIVGCNYSGEISSPRNFFVSSVAIKNPTQRALRSSVVSVLRL
jgi:hypothetical protein